MVILDRMAWCRARDLGTTRIAGIKEDLTLTTENPYVKVAPEPVKHYEKRTDLPDGPWIGLPREYFFETFKGVPAVDKTHYTHLTGVWGNPPKFAGTLREGQRVADETVIKAFRSGSYGGWIKAKCGAGKTITAIHLIARMKTPTVVLVHKTDLMDQWEKEINRFLPDANIVKVQASSPCVKDAHIVIATFQTLYSRMDSFRESGFFDHFGFLVSDECFPSYTLVDGRAISTYMAGDMVRSVNHDTGTLEHKRVTRVFKRKVGEKLLRLRFSGATTDITCTPNHPLYIKGIGYQPANVCKPNQEVLYVPSLPNPTQESNSPLQGMWGKGTVPQCAGVLLPYADGLPGGSSLLQPDMQRLVDKEGGCEHLEAVELQIRLCTDEGEEPHAPCRDTGESFPNTESHGPQTACAWGKWPWSDATTETLTRFTRGWLDDGAHNPPQGVQTLEPSVRDSISIPLQDRHCESHGEDCDRGGRVLPLSACEERTGQEEGQSSSWVRLESIEVLEQGGRGGFGKVCEDGYVYNLEVEDNHNYFAEGVLVHNCHRVPATTFSRVVNSFPARYRLGLTATPDRADGQGCLLNWIIGPRLVTMQGQTVTGSYYVAEWGAGKKMKLPKIRGGGLNTSKIISIIAEDEERNSYIAKLIVRAVEKGRKVLLLTDRVKQLDDLEFLLFSLGDKLVKYRSTDDMGPAQDPSCRCVLATYGMFGEGTDIPALDTLILATPRSRIEQMVGRIQRPMEGKRTPLVVDILDTDISYAHMLFKARERVYREQLGFHQHTTKKRQ